MIVDKRPDWVAPWVFGIAGGTWYGEGQAIGLTRGEMLVAGVVFDHWNGSNINMTVASDGSRHWLNRDYLRRCFHYPFAQLKVRRITAVVAESNHDSRRFTEHIGFELETRLKDAHPLGDLLVYVMRPEACRWLEGKKHG